MATRTGGLVVRSAFAGETRPLKARSGELVKMGDHESVAPGVGGFVPTNGSTIAPADVIGFRVTGAVATPEDVTIYAVTDSANEVVYASGAFASGYVGRSSRNTITNGYDFSIGRDLLWKTSTLVLHVSATDSDGNITSTTSSYTVDPAPTAPSIDTTSPPTITRTDSVAFVVADYLGNAVATTWITVTLDDGSTETIYDAANGFYAPYSAGSSISGTTFTVVHDAPGWTSAGLVFNVLALDQSIGSSYSLSFSLTCTDPASGGTPPVISNILPAPGTPIAPTQAIQMDITDPAGFRAIILMVHYANVPQYEVIYDGDGFAAGFAQSAKTAITNGFRFVVVKTDGWPSGPIFKVRPIDVGGNEPGP